MDCAEPSLDELLSDPIALALMESDGLEAEDVRALMLEMRHADE
jgi:hypothetical protein